MATQFRTAWYPPLAATEGPGAIAACTFHPPHLLHRLLAQTWLADLVLARRAREVVGKAKLEEHLPSAGHFLDVGAGTGHVMEAVLMRSSARRCTSVDPSWTPAAAVARRLNRVAAGRWRFLAADGADLPFADRSFDAAWAAFVLHHMPCAQQARLLSEVSRVVRRGGAFLLLEDTPDTPEQRARLERNDRRLNLELQREPHFYRTPAQWRECLAAHRFAVIAEAPFERVFPRATLKPVPHRMFVCRNENNGR